MKKILLTLFVGFVGIISFCSSAYLGKNVFSDTNIPANSSTGYSVFVSSNNINCFYVSNTSNFSCTFNGYSVSNTSQFLCFQNDNVEISCSNTSNLSKVIRRQIIYLDNLTGYCSDCPICDSQYTSLECQTEYNLIPIEEVDINYCVGNGLCPSEMGSGDYTGDLHYSNFYINDILHPGKQNIFVNIPDYITWDYNFTGDDFNLYVGSGYDVDYINSVIDINSYRPTSEDFTNVFVSGLTLVMPYIVIVLFIVFIRKLIKRIFK